MNPMLRVVLYSLIYLIIISHGSSEPLADTVSWPVSVAIPTGIVGEMNSMPVSVAIPTGMLGEMSSKPVSVGIPTGILGEMSSKPVSVAMPTSTFGGVYESRSATVGRQPESLGDPDLVGLWHMDGDWSDSSGNGNHLSPVGGVNFSADNKGGLQSASFNGSNGYAATTPSSGMNFSTNFTLMGWVKPLAAQMGGILDRGQENAGSWEIFYEANQSISYRHNWNRSQGWEAAYATAGSVPVNAWTHIAVVYTDRKVSLFVNGKEDLNGAKTFNNNAITSSSDWFEIGVNRPGGDEYFNGLIDEVAIYKRALTADEIAQQYAAGISSANTNVPAAPVLNTVPAYAGATSIALSGTRPANTSIWVNNKKIAAADASTTWQGAYTNLQPGINLLNITALDEVQLLQSQTVSKTVFFDNMAPVIESSIPANNSDTVKAVGNVYITLYDANAGVDIAASIQGATVKNSAGQVIAGTWNVSGTRSITFTPSVMFASDTFTATIQAADLVGNKQQQQIVFTTHDISKPTTKITLSGTKDSAGWYSTPVTVTLVADDTIDGSGVAKVEYNLDNGTTWLTYATPFVIDQDGKTPVQYRATDKVGNVETTKSQEINVNKTGLVGWWKMDGDWKDSSLLANDLTAVNAAAFDADAKIGTNAAKFNGSNAYLRRASGNGLPLGDSPRTYMAWIKPFSYPDSTYNGIIAYGPMQCTNGSLLSIKNNGQLSMAFWCNDTYQTVGPPATLNQWNHVAFTYESGTSVKFYMNGQFVQESAVSAGKPNTMDGPLRIGSTDDPGRVFNGLLDDVRIYNRALSSTEVMEQYRNISIDVPVVDPVVTPVNTATITLSGTKPANTSVVISSGSTGVEIAPQSDAAAWAATTWSGQYTLSLGMNNLNITSKDVDGYHSQPATVSVALDQSAPSVVSATPITGGILNTPVATITINLQDAFSVLDLPATIASATVKTSSNFDVSGSWATSGSGTTGTATFTADMAMNEGGYTATITPTDSFGNQATATVSFTVDMTAPVAPTIDQITSPINTTSKIISGTKSSDSSRVVVASVGATTGTYTYPASTTWSTTISGLHEGLVTVTAYSVDSAGNQSGVTSSGFTVDLTAPAKPGITAPNSPTNQTSITLSGVKEANSWVYVNNSKLSARLGDTAWSSTVSLDEGSNTITVFAKDEAGNQSLSAQVSVVRDTTPPTIAASTPTVNAITGSVGSVSITLSGGTSVPDLTSSLAGAVVKNASGTVISGAWSVSGDAIIFTPSDALAEGVYTVTIYPVDALGNRGSASFSFTVDRGPPTVQNLDISPTSPLKAGNATFILTFSESMNTNIQPTVTFGSANYGISGSWITAKTWRGSATLAATTGDGSYSVTVKGAKDLAGNTMADQIAGTFVLDTIAPAAPTVAAVTPLTKTATQLLTGTKLADTAVVINGTARVALNSATTWSYSYPLAEGINTLTIVARDAAGNDSAAISPAPAITLDTTPPLFTVDVVTNPATSATQTISGKKESGCIIKMNGNVIVDATDQTAIWSTSITLVDGITNHFVFSVNDTIGNITTKTLDILYDSAPPTTLASGVLTADGSGKGTEVTISWPSYVEPTALAYYRVFQGNADFTNVSGLTPVGTVNKGTKTFKATGLIQGSRTWFAVVPVSTSGNSDANVSTASAIPNDTLPPENVTAFSAVAGYSVSDANTVSLLWTASADSTGDLADQILYVDAGSGYDGGTALGKTATTLIKKGLNDATAYKFKITTRDTGNHESSGSIVQAVTRLANPVGLTAVAGNNKATLSWTAVASSYVKFYNIYRLKSDSAQSDMGGMSLVKSQTTTSFTDTGLTNDSTYQYAVTVLNTSGAERSSVQSVAVAPRGDTVGPVLSGVSLTANQVVTKPVAITISAADAESSMERIELYLDETRMTTIQGGSLNWNWNPADTTDGNHTVKIVAYDVPGNKTESSIPVVVSLAAPPAPVITTTFGAPINLKSTTITGTTQPGATVSLRVNGVVVSSTPNAASPFSFVAVPLSEGDNYISAKASNRGGESGFSADVKVSVVTAAPSAPAALTAKVLAAGTIQFSWQAGPNGAPAGYNLYEGPVGSTSISAPGVLKTNSSLITYLLREYIPADDAAHSYMVTAIDGAGNESAVSNSVSATADRIAPAASEVRFSSGGTTPADNTYGPGTLNIAMTVSEALGETPFLSLEPQSGSPLVVALRKVDDTRYEASLSIDATSPHGATTWKFSGKDMVGNRGNGQGSGPKLDVKGPVATVIAPVTLLKTTAGPVIVSIKLDEASTITPLIALTSPDNASAAVTGLTSADTINWSGSVDPAGLGEGTGRFVISDVRDRFNNKGATVAGGAGIILYKVAPPASFVPTGLTARAFKGREVRLAWKAVTDASGYKIYRQGTNEVAGVLVNTISGAAAVSAVDTPADDGTFAYRISSVGLLDVESAQSTAVSVITDGTAPPVPTGLALSLTGNGVKAEWQAGAGETPLYYRIYRSAAPISDITGLTPVSTVNQLSGYDPSPIASMRYYSVTSLDQLGNESGPTSSQEITIPVMSVRNLVLTQVDTGKPSLSWEAGETGLQGFHIYRNGNRITTMPTLSTTFSDGYYSGGSVIYGISAVNGMGTESQVREVTLPIFTIGLKEGTLLRRGVLENAVITASLPTGSTTPLTLDSVTVKIGNLPESSENGPFVIPTDKALEISKVTATEATAQPQTAAVISAVIKPVPGVTAKITRSVIAGVIAAGAPLEIFNEPLVRGTQVGVRLKFTNTGTAGSEIVTSENSVATSQVRLLLKDQDGNILAQSAMSQRTGSSVVDSGGYATARLNPGESFLFEPIAVNIPSNAPYKVILEAQIDTIWFHYKQDDQVKAPGMTNSADATIADVSYMAAAQTDRSVYRQGENVVITGTATSTKDGKPMANVPVKIGISVKGFDRFASVNSNASGTFSYTFTPGSSEAGSYSVWAIHPDLSDRSVQAQFSVIGLQVSPLQASIRILKGQGYDIPVTLTNLGGSPLSALAFNTGASSGVTASLSNSGSTTLTAGETRTVTFRVAAEQNAPESGFASLDISTAEGLTSRVEAAITSTTAIPLISTTPSYIDTGLMRGNQRIENLTIRNSGAGTLTNPRIEGPSLPWLVLTVDKNIGDIPAGQSRTVGILIKPVETMPQGVYDDRIVIYSDNHIPYTYNIQITVTSSATGSVQFSVMNELLKKVQGATVTIQHQSLSELYYTMKTAADGTAAQFDVPEGRYSYNISAPSHKPYSASFVITPGITTSVPVALEVNLVTVEWSVTPVTIEDHYDILVTQTFETEVPTSVIVTEPPSMKLPAMEPGQVFNGEFTITNYGLIAADYAGISFPTSFDDYDIEVLAQIPKRLEANQKIVVPYRITKRVQAASTSLAGEITGFGGGSCSGSQSITTTWTQVICPHSANERTKTGSSTHSIYWNYCLPSVGGVGGVGGTWNPVSYTGGGSGGGGQSGSGGSGGSYTTALASEQCFAPKCILKHFLNATRECSGSSVIMANGTYEFSAPELSLPARGLPVEWTRYYRSNRIITKNGTVGFVELLDGPLGYGWMTPYFARIENGDTWVDGQGLYQAFTKDSSGNFAANLAEGVSLKKTSTGYELIKRGAESYLFNDSGKLTTIKDLKGNTVSLDYDVEQKLTQIKDSSGRVALNFTYNAGGHIATTTDAAGRTVSYEYDTFGNLIKATGPSSAIHTYTYNSYHGITSKTNALDETYTIEYQYPSEGVVSRILDPIGTTLLKQGEPLLGHEMKYAYDFKNGVFYVTDYSGNTRKKVVNTQGALVFEELLEASGNTTLKKIEYLDSRTEKITDGAGIATTIQRDEWNSITRITDGEGNSTATTYNSIGRPLTVTDPLGIVTRIEYDATGNLTKIIKAEGKAEQQSSSYTYDQFGQITGATMGSASTTITNNQQGQPLTVTDPLGNATRIEYDAAGNMVASIDPLNNRKEYSYDASGNLVGIKDPLGNITSTTYNSDNRLKSVKDPLGRTTNIISDFRDRITEITDPTGNRKTFGYDGNSNLIKITDTAGVTTLAYDPLNRLKSLTDPMGNITGYDYSDSGSCPSCGGSSTANPARITDPLGNVTRNIYNKIGKLTSVTDPLGNATGIIRDAVGRATRKTDANGNITSYQYDSLGRIINQTDAEGGATEFSYDTPGNLITLTDPNGNSTSFDYDLAGRKIKETKPLGQTTAYGYYPNGLLKTVTDAKGQTTTNNYDAANRLTEITYADGTKDTFGYDAAGNMTSYAKPGVTGTITYNELGRKLSETVNYGTFSKTFSYSYDATGNKATYTSPEGKQYSYTYNKNNQATGITVDGKTINMDYQWVRQTKQALPNNVTTDYSYNANSWLSAIETKQNSATLTSSGYQFDKVGNITNRTTDTTPTSYGYDKTYQLTTAGAESFSYDKVGNRTSNGGSANANNQLTANATASYSYDANGNTTSKTVGTQVTTYAYDVRDRLAQVTLPDGRTATYTYDPFGRRTKKAVAGVVTYYLYSDEGLIGEYATDGANSKAYTWQPDGIWGTNPVTQIEGGTTYYYHNDHLGTPQRMTDESGNVVWSAIYSAFGKATVTGTITNNLRFPGQYFDEETGMHYNWQRYFDAESGRYVSVDPLGFRAKDVNLYRYVQNNPINFVDPSGLYGKDVHFYKTREWANSTGFSPALADRIASADQRLDESYFTNPLNPLSYIDVSGWLFHFRNQQYASVGLQQAIDADDPEMFGKFLHVWQDTFSHAGLNPITHAIAGTAPDKYVCDSGRDTAMRESTKYWLKQYKIKNKR